MMAHRSIFLILFFCFAGPWSIAQTQWIEFEYGGAPKPTKCRLGRPDSIAMRTAIQECIRATQEKGFMAARVDSMELNNLRRVAYVTLGPRYYWDIDNSDLASAQWLELARVPMGKLNRSVARPSDIAAMAVKTAAFLEKEGFPFSKLLIRAIGIDSSVVRLQPVVDPGPLIRWDTLIIKGNAKISHRFMARYLGFKPASPYSEAMPTSLPARIIGIPFLTPIRTPEVEFVREKANLYLYLTNSKASRFSGLVGFSSENSSIAKLKFTGDVNLLLRNTFGNGEELGLKWNALGEGTQKLHLQFAWPFIAGSAFGAEGHFKLQKQDTSFLNINSRIAATLFTDQQIVVGAGVEFKQSMVLYASAATLHRNFSTYLYQFTMRNQLHSPQELPVPGFWYEIQAGVGRQQVERIEVSRPQTVLQVLGNAMVTFSVIPRHILVRLLSRTEVQYKNGGHASVGGLLTNDLLRIGGSEILRGFNQEALSTDRYSLATAECHVMAQQKASLYLFADKAYVGHIVNNERVFIWPQGIGVGAMLMTGNGILKFNYALGKGGGQDFKLRNSKIHLGFTTNF